MSVTLHPHLHAQLAEAVEQARHARHHQDCDCGQYRRDGAPFCTPAEWTATYLVDRILHQIQRLNQ